MEHLILKLRGGLCNRLRAFASARRLCHRTGAKCSIIWDWGNFEQFFAPLADVEVVRFSTLCAPRSRRMNESLKEDRGVDLRQRTVKLCSGVIFWASDESRIYVEQLVAYVPRLSLQLAQRAQAFVSDRLTGAVGFHIRRTDNVKAQRNSPDDLFLTEAQRVVASGRSIFLATDNLATEAMMKERFGERVITHPRRKVLAQRWPRPSFDAMALEDDLLDLFLLASTEYVVGCKGSSFSSMAMALNGSPQSRWLVQPEQSLAPTASSAA
jgi:hypothetical protein